MHTHQLEYWKHSHQFLISTQKHQSAAVIVLWLTAVVMVVEIIAGTVLGSMALLADGWHMMTHVAAFAITLFAYSYARKHQNNPEFSFGTGKVITLGGFASSIALAVVAFMVGLESIERLFHPEAILFDQAIAIAILGFVVNGISVFILHEHSSHTSHSHHHHDHHHEDKSDHDHHHEHIDHNYKAAYFHVLADTLTSILAIIALLLGKYLDWIWLDAIIGLLGMIIIAKWAWGLIQHSSTILLDKSVENKILQEITERIEQDQDNRIVDLHAWYISPQHISVVISLVTHYPQSPDYYKKLLESLPQLAHIIVEVNACDGKACLPQQ